MEEIAKLLIGVAFLLLGFVAGNWLSKITREELKGGRTWFKTIVLLSGAGAVLSLIFLNDTIFFTFLFIGIVTSRSIK